MAKKANKNKAAVAKEVKKVISATAEEFAAAVAPVAEEKAAEVVQVAETAEVTADAAAKEPKKRGRKPGSGNAVKTVKKNTVEKKNEKQEVVYVQFAGEEVVVEEVMEKAKAAYVAEGHRASAIKSLRLYIKPEERKAYYVINEKAAGSINL
ncbi:MAG: DUF6465 family protein [Lachnospiraceae bacterium]|nr:DUF6465 family protein [Lachnospiraceae bacterium]